MNILKAVSNLFSYSSKDIDIEDIHIHCNDHKDTKITQFLMVCKKA